MSIWLKSNLFNRTSFREIFDHICSIEYVEQPAAGRPAAGRPAAGRPRPCRGVPGSLGPWGPRGPGPPTPRAIRISRVQSPPVLYKPESSLGYELIRYDTSKNHRKYKAETPLLYKQSHRNYEQRLPLLCKMRYHAVQTCTPMPIFVTKIRRGRKQRARDR